MPRDIYGLYDDYEDYDEEGGPPQSWLVDSFGGKPSAAPLVPVPPAEEPTRIGVGLPPVGVVPARPRLDGKSVEIELSAEVDGWPVAIVFSTVERLIERLGRYQPWMMVPSADVPNFLGTAVFAIVLDPSEAVCRPQWTAERLQVLEVYQA